MLFSFCVFINFFCTFKSFVFDTKFIYEENKYNNITYLNSNYSNSLKEISDNVYTTSDGAAEFVFSGGSNG